MTVTFGQLDLGDHAAGHDGVGGVVSAFRIVVPCGIRIADRIDTVAHGNVFLQAQRTRGDLVGRFVCRDLAERDVLFIIARDQAERNRVVGRQRIDRFELNCSGLKIIEAVNKAFLFVFDHFRIAGSFLCLFDFQDVILLVQRDQVNAVRKLDNVVAGRDILYGFAGDADRKACTGIACRFGKRGRLSGIVILDRQILCGKLYGHFDKDDALLHVGDSDLLVLRRCGHAEHLVNQRQRKKDCQYFAESFHDFFLRYLLC